MLVSQTRSWRMFTGFAFIAIGVTSAALGACGASTPRGATDAHLAQAKTRAAEGALHFEQQCAGCHGDRGQGLTGGPAIMGPRALAEYPAEVTAAGNPQLANPGQVRTQRLTQVPGAAARDPFQSAADVYRYISTRMPMPARRAASLPAEQYWAILNFMLISHGAEVPEGGVNEANAASVKIPH